MTLTIPDGILDVSLTAFIGLQAWHLTKTISIEKRLAVVIATCSNCAMKKPKSLLSVLFLCLASFVAMHLIGCSHLAPGADPVVVRAEQTESTANTTFHTLLSVDNQDRNFWRSQVPGFHNFCEWLREPQTYPPGSTNVLQRDLALLLAMDDMKLSYQAGRNTSNDLETVRLTLETVLQEAVSWLPIATNKPPTIH